MPCSTTLLQIDHISDAFADNLSMIQINNLERTARDPILTFLARRNILKFDTKFRCSLLDGRPIQGKSCIALQITFISEPRLFDTSGKSVEFPILWIDRLHKVIPNSRGSTLDSRPQLRALPIKSTKEIFNITLTYGVLAVRIIKSILIIMIILKPNINEIYALDVFKTFKYGSASALAPSLPHRDRLLLTKLARLQP